MKEKILIIDDAPEVAKILKQYILEPLQYQVIVAGDGETGLNLAETQSPDLIMLDLSMPRMNGLQVLKRLREMECQAPVIFMTMHGSENIAVEVFRLGVRDYLMKPFTMDEVKQSVDKALREARLLREKEELARNLIAADTLRQTVVTLSHYLNNNLMVVQTGLALIGDTLQKPKADLELVIKVASDCLKSSRYIVAVINVLQQVTKIQDAAYYGDTKMIDIEAALREEIQKLQG